jgi:hypothetical protein
MATQITKFADNAGKLFDSEAEADASNAKAANQVVVDEFVNTHFPTKPGAPKGNPHAGTAKKAIFLWIGRQQGLTVEA